MYGVRLGWEDLPARVHDWAGELLGGPVVSAESQPGGFSPGTADRVRTADGRRAFVKAVSAAQNPDTPALHRREGEVLAGLTGVGSVPRLLGVYDDGEWVALMIEDVEGRHPLPWTDDLLVAALDALAELAEVQAPPDWPALEDELVGEMGAWARLRDTPPEDLELDPWCQERLDELVDRCARTLPRMAGPHVAHTDIRADNLLVEGSGAVRVIDWPWVSRGAAWCDAAMLLLNVRWAGDLDVRPHLPALHALGATDDDVIGLLAGLTGFFTEACRRPPSPGLPTLREFQRQQAAAGRALLQELWPAG